MNHYYRNLTETSWMKTDAGNGSYVGYMDSRYSVQAVDILSKKNDCPGSLRVKSVTVLIVERNGTHLGVPRFIGQNSHIKS